MANSGLDFRNAALGAAFGGFVGPIVDTVIKNLDFVSHCQEQCTALREELKKIKPLLEKISDQNKGDPAMKNWLDVFDGCVKKAEEILKKCKSDRSVIWDRAYEVRYGGEILKLKDEISSNVNLASLALLTVQGENGSKSSRGACGTVQEVPGKILGMEGHFQRVKSLIIEGRKSKGSSCIGIRGMGGAGKTLLAKMVNNDKEIQGTFGKESVVWITVGRDAQISVIYERMRKCLQVDSDGGSLEDQRTELRNEFLKRSVLLILDDVWDGIVHEYKGMVEWLNIARGCGSVTVVTTRDESITKKCVNVGEEIILRLSEEHSWELFCTHAFGTDTVGLNKDLEAVAMDVCKECKCLPLALKVIGLAMKGKCDIREWRKTLCRLQRSSMVDRSVEQELFERLRISYEQLDGATKICFLYFAAFPEDCEITKKYLCQLWVVEGLFGEDLDEKEAWDEAHCALHELLGRSLIEGCNGFRNVECVRMHDILRDLAIQMTREGKECERESLFEVEKEGVEEFPRTWLGLAMKVERLSIWGNKMKRFPENFKAPNLKICMLYPEPWHFVDIEFESSECIIGSAFFGNLERLKYFKICANSTIRQFPESMGGLRYLQHLNLSGCGTLQQLPENMGELGSLKYLNLWGCKALQKFSESMGGLGSLQYLDLSYCETLKQLPENIGGLGSLQHLNLSYCIALQQLPKSMGGLGSLQHFNLKGCTTLRQLSKSMGGLRSLQHLNLSYCETLKQFPENMGELGSLQYLNLNDCKVLQQLLESMGGLGSLRHFNLRGCTTLRQLPESMGGLGSLQHFNLRRCITLQQLPESMGGLGSLQHLDLSYYETLKQLPKSMGRLGFLQYLNLGGCRTLQQLLESMGGLGSLQHLSLAYCRTLQELPQNMGGLGSLQHPGS